MLRNYIEESCNAPGTNSVISLAGAPTGRRRWRDAFASGSAVYYGIDDGSQAEWGIGTLTWGTPDTLTRATVLGNTAGTTSRLNFSGACRVFNEMPAERLVYVVNATGGPSIAADSLSRPLWAGTAGGDANSLLLSVTPAPSSLLPGTMVLFQTAQANTDIVTLNLNGLGARALVHARQTMHLAPGDLQANTLHAAAYDGSYWRLITPAYTPAVPIGAILDYTGATPPPGYVWANGQNLLRAQYPFLHSLYAAAGYPYGAGDGSTTFGVPDLRGRAVFGRDNMGGVAAGRITAAVSGINATQLGAAGGDERMHAHTHGVSDPTHSHTGTTSSSGDHQHTASNILLATGGTGGFSSGASYMAGNTATSPSGDHTHTVSTNAVATGITVSSYGAGNAQNMPPALICDKIIFAGWK